MSFMEPVAKSYRELLSKYNLSKVAMCKKINVAKQTLDNILNGVSLPGMKIIYKTLEEFPEVDPTWLITYKGEMIPNEDNNSKCLKEVERLKKELETVTKLAQAQETILKLMKSQIDFNRHVDE